ncbi:MAG TPA: hypothetical protein VFW28_19740 [Micropepsaceae bacterium]|nr:hypothetical protein [Micropepsaceae bacterium]
MMRKIGFGHISKLIMAAMLPVLFGSAPAPAQPTAGSASGVATPPPDFSGLWQRPLSQGRMGAVKNLSERADVVIGDWQDPVLQPWAAAIVKQHGDMEAAGFAAPETKQTCWPGSVPNMLSIPSQMEVLQTPKLVTVLYSNDHQVRFIYMDQPHSAHVTSSWYGESVGHYEGDTLVVDTIGIASKPMSLVDVFGTPHTDALHVVERFHLINGGKTIRVDIRVEDPGTFTRAWDEGSIFNKADEQFDEYVCAENNPLIGIDKSSGDMPRARYVPPF